MASAGSLGHDQFEMLQGVATIQLPLQLAFRVKSSHYFPRRYACSLPKWLFSGCNDGTEWHLFDP